MVSTPWDPRFVPGDPLISPDFAGWWRRGFTIVRRAWRPMAAVQVITVVPALALLIPAQLATDLAADRLFAEPPAPGTEFAGFGDFMTASGYSLLATLGTALIYSIGTLATARLVVTTATGGQPHAGRALLSVLTRIPALIGWSQLSALVALVALMLCVVPILYVGAVLMLMPIVVLFEPGRGIGRCFALFNHDFAAAVARVATVAGLALGVTLGLALLGTVVSTLTGLTSLATNVTVLDSIASSTMSGVASLVCGVVLTPLVVAAYADLRARHEPFTTAHLSNG